jgi:hypothetical protein
VQRAVVRRVLASMTEVESFCDGYFISGGWGATLVRLKTRGNAAAE